MNLQYLADHRGNVTGVFIPIQEWEQIRAQLHLPDESKTEHRQELIEAFDEMKEIKAEKRPKPALNDLLDELRNG